MSVIPEPSFCACYQLTPIWPLQTVYKWQDKLIHKVLELLVSSQRSTSWIKVPVLREWSKVRTSISDLDSSALKIVRSRTSSIESLWRLPSKENNSISVHIQFTPLCLNNFWVLAIWPQSLRRFCSPTSSLRFRKLWKRSKIRLRRQMTTSEILDHQCLLNLRLKCNCSGIWLPSSFRPIKILSPEDMTTKEWCRNKKAICLVELESNSRSTIYIRNSMVIKLAVNIMICIFRRPFKCMKVMDCQVSHLLTFLFTW